MYLCVELRTSFHALTITQCGDKLSSILGMFIYSVCIAGIVEGISGQLVSYHNRGVSGDKQQPVCTMVSNSKH